MVEISESGRRSLEAIVSTGTVAIGFGSGHVHHMVATYLARNGYVTITAVKGTRVCKSTDAGRAILSIAKEQRTETPGQDIATVAPKSPSEQLELWRKDMRARSIASVYTALKRASNPAFVAEVETYMQDHTDLETMGHFEGCPAMVVVTLRDGHVNPPPQQPTRNPVFVGAQHRKAKGK